MIDPIVYHPELLAMQLDRRRWPWRCGRWGRPDRAVVPDRKKKTGGA